jgi:hypothetical protein
MGRPYLVDPWSTHAVPPGVGFIRWLCGAVANPPYVLSEAIAGGVTQAGVGGNVPLALAGFVAESDSSCKFSSDRARWSLPVVGSDEVNTTSCGYG